MKIQSSVMMSLLLALTSVQIGCAASAGKQTIAVRPAEGSMVKDVLADWPARPKLAAYRMIGKYGMPQEATPMRLVWRNNGRWKRTVVTRSEIPHNFPRLHMDFLEQTIDYHVSVEKSNDLIAFDGSTKIDRTAGELSSRCDMEEANLLTLNLVNDIVVGKKNVDQARMAFGQNEVAFLMGKKPAYMTGLQFQPQSGDTANTNEPADVERVRSGPGTLSAPGTADPDKPVISGLPRLASSAGGAMSDGEILGMILAVDLNEIDAASDAVKKNVSPQVRQFAQTLHLEHGKNLEKTRTLAEQIRVTALMTPAVDQQRVNAADNLAKLIQSEGKQFETGYVDMMIKDHTKVLAMIDGQLQGCRQS